MRFVTTPVHGTFVVELDTKADDRGSFARVFCSEEFVKAGIAMQVYQANLSHNNKRHTLRGLHFQAAPFAEAKTVQCIRGRIFDVAVDLRPSSPTYRAWSSVELNPGRVFYIPPGCAHGFITLEDDSDIYYLMGAPFVAAASRTLRWDDPAIGVRWPMVPAVITSRDAEAPLLAALERELAGYG